MTNETPTVARLTVKVAPGASKDQLVGWLGETLKIRVRAQPEKGKANAAVIKLLSKLVDTSSGNIRVCAGQTSRNKVIEILGISNAKLRERLAELIT